jgi:hypothetical protein
LFTRCSSLMILSSLKSASSSFNKSVTVSTTYSACVHMWVFWENIWHNFFLISVKLWQSDRRQIAKDGKTSRSSSTVNYLFSQTWVSILFFKSLVMTDRWPCCAYAHSSCSWHLPHTFHKLVLDFSRADFFFGFKKLNCQMHLTIGGISD